MNSRSNRGEGKFSWRNFFKLLGRDRVAPQIAAATFPQDVLSTRDYGYGYVGLRDLNTFNYLRNTTINAPDYVWQTSVDNSNSSTLPRPTLLPMSARRWYPTSTTLGDGRAVVVSGLAYVNATGVPVQGPPEVYNPDSSLLASGAMRVSISSTAMSGKSSISSPPSGTRR